MNRDCFDIGTFQAFLDGELSPADASSLTSHVAVCNNCATQLACAEDESAVVYAVLGREMDALVPTQRLWHKINDSISDEREKTPAWRKAWASISSAFTVPTFAAAASLLLVIGVVSTLIINREFSASPTTNIAAVKKADPVSPAPPNISAPDTQADLVTVPLNVASAPKNNVARPIAAKASYASTVALPVNTVDQAPRTNDGYLPGEETYVKTISSLSKTVNVQKDSALKPSERIAYERDMAVVDDAIGKLKAEVKKNPKNESAKQVLYSSYQNKIDLLSSVSQKEELVASLNR